MKGKNINKGIKNDGYSVDNQIPLDNQLQFKPFMLDENIKKITLNDSLIIAIQCIINKELELIKVNDEEIQSIIDNVNGKKIPD